MSWDSYIDNIQGHSGKDNCDKACIIGKDGGAAWTTHNHRDAFVLQDKEGENIAKCFASKDFTSFQANGIRIGGQKYQFLREDNNTVYGKLKGNGALTIQASKSAIVIGHCPEGKSQGNLNIGVGKIVEYLESLNM